MFDFLKVGIALGGKRSAVTKALRLKQSGEKVDARIRNMFSPLIELGEDEDNQDNFQISARKTMSSSCGDP